MNEIIHNNFKRFLAGIGALVLLFPLSIVNVFADASSIINNYQNSITFRRYKNIPSSGSYISSFILYLSSTIQGTMISGLPFHTVFFQPYNSDYYTLYVYVFDEDIQQYGYSSGSAIYANIQTSVNDFQYSGSDYNRLESTYTATDSATGTTGRKIWYTSFSYPGSSSNQRFEYFNNTYDVRIRSVNQNANITTFFHAVSLNSDPPYPWNGSNSSGGISWSDGTELSAENTAKYSQVYIVMDTNNDKSVSQEEVNYYNYTYNTNYDYSVINEGNTFDEDKFLYWVATEINSGNDNPGGGTGSGGGSGSVSGGITIGDNSFTQTQSQSIEQNAVNVTVTNNNELTNENLNHINQIINNNPESTENTFQDAVSNMNQFKAIATAFAALAGVILGWLPSWVTGLLGLSFSVLSVMIIFRLIHLFV